ELLACPRASPIAHRDDVLAYGGPRGEPEGGGETALHDPLARLQEVVFEDRQDVGKTPPPPASLPRGTGRRRRSSSRGSRGRSRGPPPSWRNGPPTRGRLCRRSAREA